MPAHQPQVCLVLGASGGIGSALCRQLAERGDSLVLFGRNRERIEELAKSLHSLAIVGDATSFTEVDRAFDEVTEKLGPIGAVANCTGSLLLKPAHLTTEAEYQSTIAASLTTAFAVTRAAGRAMTGGGSVVLVSSAAAQTGLANHEAIAAAKAGIVGLMLSAAATYANRGLRFNAVSPGLIRTPLTEKLLANEASAKASIAMHALGRVGEPDDVARAIAWLMDSANNWITGQVIGVDGGLATLRTRPRA